MNNKLFRILICLLLVCSLMVYNSPLHANALVVEGAAAYYALGLAAMLILDVVGIVYCLETADQIQALGKNWDTFMIDGSSAFDYDLEDWEEYKTATIIQFTPGSDPDNDDDFPDGYDPNKVRIKTLEAALNVGICAWLESFIEKNSSLVARPAVGSVSFYGCGEFVPARTHIVSPRPTVDSELEPDQNSYYSVCLWANVDCYVYSYASPDQYNSYDFMHVFVPADSSVDRFTLYKHTVNKYNDSSSVVMNSKESYVTLDNGDLFYFQRAFDTVTLYPSSVKTEWIDTCLSTVHYFSSEPLFADAMKYLMFECLPEDISSVVLPSLITGTVVGGVTGGSLLTDFDLPDIELGNLVSDGSDLDVSIKDNQNQIANGDKSWSDYIEQVSPGTEIVVPDPPEIIEPDPTEVPNPSIEPEPSVSPTEFPGVEPGATEVPNPSIEPEPSVSPTEVPGVDPDATEVPNPDSGSDPDTDGDSNTEQDDNPSWLKRLLDGLWELLQRLGEMLLNGIKSIFVPSADYVTDKVNALRENFGFIDSVIRTGEYIRDSVYGASGPPVIYVDLGAAEGDTNWGGKVLLTDFAWYAKYKSTVDTWLSAALWGFFGWRVFHKLPGIISGESGYIGDMVGYHEKNRKKE